MIKNIVLIHGIAGIKDGSYFYPLKEKFEKMKINVYMPKFKGFREEGFAYQEWEDYFKANIQLFNDETILIAQSLGTQFAVRFLSKYKLGVALYVSCAGAYDFKEMREEITNAKLMAEKAKDFLPTQADFLYMKNAEFEKYSLFTDNDTFFYQDNLEKYSKEIGATPFLIKGKAHFNVPAGVKRLPELEDLIEEFVKKSATK